MMDRTMVPSKRLRNWHRKTATSHNLKPWVRAMAAGDMPTISGGVNITGDSALARRWLASKRGR